MLKVKGLLKDYKNVRAVNDISFDLEEGDIVGLLGPNGAGKSTTIKTIAGLLRATYGDVTINGHKNTSVDAKSNFSYIPEMPELYEMLTVWEHIKFIAYAYKVSNWEEKAEKLLRRYDMWDRKDKLSKELSKGMKQKVSICCGLLPDPGLYLFDEPMIGLDPKAIRETKIIFKELSERGKTIFVSTHLLDSIENLCKRVLVMKSGTIIADESVDNLKKKLGNNTDVSLEDVFLEVTKDE
ncbi:ABC transporter ATP-binding protein [Clostridium sp. D2Q-11]|uniref:ABC transporter ATP-binding protein n=1 Tax=Anaeromonas frigoriresistens TaxID=2683708 RepID=A0A942V035_9FIRM|nr:ABC transporter ATP-binding protein [Anaeromonas frigoriresistens]MBS4538722.1 ABC transporter ATP-binding protein [Anaeromonas frigoriresistens]